jgi:hypothetical protein
VRFAPVLALASVLLTGLPSLPAGACTAPGASQISRTVLPAAPAAHDPSVRGRVLRPLRVEQLLANVARPPAPLLTGAARNAPAPGLPGDLARWHLAHATTSSIS